MADRTMPPLRVALMIGAKGWRGSGASFAKVARGLERHGHAPLLLTAWPRLTAAFAAEGLPVLEQPLRNTGWREVRALRRTLEAFGADVVMTDTPRDLRVAALATRFHPARLVYRYNVTRSAKRERLADRFYARMVDAVVFQSAYAMERAQRWTPALLRATAARIPNGFDLDRFAPDPAGGAAFRRQWGIGPDTPLVLTPGKPARGKGHDDVLAALAALKAGGREIVYMILGDGVRREELEAKASALGVCARFTGFLAPADIPRALSAADVVAHLSPEEMFPNAVGEAMACARAVVAADAAGTPELVGEGGSAGLLVPPGATDRLADALDTLVRDPGRREGMGRAARERIARHFPLASMEQQYVKLFGALAGR